MSFDWYLVINRQDFEDAELVSKEVELILEDIGLVTVLVTKGSYYGITYDGVFLAIGITEANPFVFDGYAVYLHPETDDIYLGIELDES